ncbi:MAG: hypothetical protein HOH95_15180 [Dehalococcoidia bacterium]|jgi:hypothetical protein|nr:hypothetical protein [Dehalococcoidia bacterium]
MPSNFPRLHPSDPRSLLPFVLATFNTTGLVLLILIFAYRDGGLADELDDLNTLTGLGLFGFLWLVTWATTSRALRAFESPTAPRWWEIARAGIVWGGVTGLVVLVSLIALTVSADLLGATDSTTSDSKVDEAGIILFYGFVASGPAFIVGAAIGFAVAFIDYILLRLANLASLPPKSPPSTNGTSDA